MADRSVPSSDFAEQFAAVLTLSRRPGFGAAKLRQWIDTHGSPFAALAATVPAPASDKSTLSEEIARASDYLATGGRATYYGAPDYPPRLAEVGEPPPYLFWRGAVWPPPQRAVAVVGPRKTTPAALDFARRLAAGLARSGVAVISGGARGVDRAAHEGAMDVGGITIVVTATGIDRWYPPEAAGLFNRAATSGCVVTELLPGTPPRRDFFPTRNRIVAGLSAALVAVGGQVPGGTWSSVRHMLRLGRPVFVWPGENDPYADLVDRVTAAGGFRLDLPRAEHVVAAIRGRL